MNNHHCSNTAIFGVQVKTEKINTLQICKKVKNYEQCMGAKTTVQKWSNIWGHVTCLNSPNTWRSMVLTATPYYVLCSIQLTWLQTWISDALLLTHTKMNTIWPQNSFAYKNWKDSFLSHWVGSGDSTSVECMNVTCFTQTGAGRGATTTTCKSIPTPS